MLASAALLLVLGLTPFGAALSPDAMRYAEVAEHLHAGRGFVVRDWSGPDPEALVPFTTYAPLYPMALSIALGFASTAERAASGLAVVTLFGTLLGCFALLRPALGRDGALAATLCLALTQPIVTVYTFAWSESLTLPLLLFACWCSISFVGASRTDAVARPALLLLGLTAALGAVAWCRYIGVLFAVLLPLTWLSSARPRRWLWDFLAAGLGYAGLVGALALRNWRLTGLLSGAEREPSMKGLGSNLADLGLALLAQVPRYPAGILLALALALVAFLALGRRGESGSSSPAPLARTTALLLASYAVGLVLLRTQHRLDRIDTRFLTPAFVLLVLLLALAAGRSRGAAGAPIRVAALFLLALFVCQGLATYARGSAGWGFDVDRGFPLSTDELYYNYAIPEHERDPGPAAVRRARRLMDGGQYELARMQLEQAHSVCEDTYEIDKSRARVAAGLGDVDSCLALLRECLAAGREPARALVLEVAGPYWEAGPRLHGKGIRFFEELRAEVDDAWWIDHDIGSLARLMGDVQLADRRQCRAFLARSRGNLEQGRYDEALADLHDAEPLCADPYPLARGRAAAFAGRGDARQSLKFTRRCLELDRARTLEDLESIRAPFRENPAFHDEGLAYDRELEAELGHLPWLSERERH